MDIKYTPDGKKVAVVGQLNSTSWIVQEVFVTENDCELPAGENFICDTLLNEPAKSWAKRDFEIWKDKVDVLRNQTKNLEADIRRLQRERTHTSQLTHALKKYVDADVSEVQTLIDFLDGKITHLITTQYGNFKILTFDDALDMNDPSFRDNSLKLVTLLGHSDGKLEWRLNQYRDDSGSSCEVFLFKSFEDAVQALDDMLTDVDANAPLIELKDKYNLINPTQDKIDAFHAKEVAQLEGSINYHKQKIKEIEAKIKVIE